MRQIVLSEHCSVVLSNLRKDIFHAPSWKMIAEDLEAKGEFSLAEEFALYNYNKVADSVFHIMGCLYTPMWVYYPHLVKHYREMVYRKYTYAMELLEMLVVVPF